MFTRKGQGISLNVIIIAAIALVVMVILIALVLNSGRGVGQSAFACEGNGGGVEGTDYVCVPRGQQCDPGFSATTTRKCSDSTEDFPLTCCLPSVI